MCVCSMLLVQYVKNININMNKCTSFVWRPYLTVQFQSDLFKKKQWHKILLEIICKLCSSPSSFLKLVCPFYSWLCCILAAVGDVLAAVWCNHSPPLFSPPRNKNQGITLSHKSSTAGQEENSYFKNKSTKSMNCALHYSDLCVCLILSGAYFLSCSCISGENK